ncbi:MAG: hypothetical protein BCS36_00235 [Desulfovibrio sp. MES5]|nr:MAG: hypothetical protein BCS36_00235 [Desulfovibrio sp. MES5]
MPLHTLVDYDALILFQITGSFLGLLCDLNTNITFVPMLDGYGITTGHALPRTYWRKFAGVKILNFSRTLHYIAIENSLVSQCYQYYQPPLFESRAPQTGLHGFFWCRRPEDISWKHIRILIGETTFDSFHLHLVPDPGQPEPERPTKDEIMQHHMTISTGWFETKDEILQLQKKANVFFAPRLEEGIGQAMLEAFSLGQCIVSPDTGTMNEYIVHGVNGLLYNPADLRALSFENAVNLGQWGRESAITGRSHWQELEQKLVEYILTPSRLCYEQALLPTRPPWIERVCSHPITQNCKSKLRPFVRRLKQLT